MFLLKTLRVKNCRGIRNGPDLTFHSGGLFLCGDNGTGKSSYIDAIEKVLTGNCRTLEGVQGISWANHATHIQSTSIPEIELIITDNNRNFSITLNQNFSSSPIEVQQFVDSAKSGLFLLQRKTILEFINSQPKERYTAIEGFLKLDDYYQFETKLKTLEKEIKETNETLKAQIKLINQTLCSQLQCPADLFIDINNLIFFLNLKIQTLGLTQITSIDELETLKSQIDIAIQQSQYIHDVSKYDNLSTQFKKFSNIEPIIDEINTHILVGLKYVHAERELKGHFYSEILETGLKWIQEDSLSHCPLCNNEIKIENVTDYVKLKLSENRSLLEIKREFEKSKQEIIEKLKLYLRNIDSIKENWIELFNESYPKFLELFHSDLSNLLYDITESVSIEKLSSDYNCLITANYADSIIETNKKIIECKKSLPVDSQYNNLVNLKTLVTYLQTNFPSYLSLTQELERKTCLERNLTVSVKLAEEGRKKAVQKLIQSIGIQANEYFLKIHPDESIGKPQLSVSDRGVGGILLESSFYEKIGDPRGYFSEGHLDSLGLCIFLAIRNLHKQRRPNFPLLILDDVLHSVDYQHRLKTAQLIFEQFRDYQIIVTTHDRMWFETLKLVFKNQSCNQYRISSWSLDDGPGFGDHKSDYEWLISSEGMQANPADKVIKSGRLLEEILQNLCDSLEVSIPFRIRGDYTLDPLWNNFYKKIKKSTLYSQNQQIFDNIEILRNQRNLVGAHYNYWAANLTGEESNQLKDSIVNLYGIVFCNDCNKFIRRISELVEGTWRCKCETLRYEKNR